MPGLARPPRSRSIAWASTVLPAPVSPVIALRPGPGRSSARSSSSRFSILSSSSTRPGLAAARDGVAPRELIRQPPELLPQAVVEARARGLGDQHLVVLEADFDLLLGAEPAHRPP